MAQPHIQRTPFLLVLLALLLSSTHTSHHTSLVYATRHQKQNSITSPVFSLPIRSRDSILQNQNYTARTISRLKGDIARVNYINSRLRNALSNSHDFLQEENILSQLTHSEGAYVTRVGVGQPVKEFDLLVDTGSDINWVQCCRGCNPKQSDQVFDPSHSSTYQPLRCSSQQCNALLESQGCSDNGTCTYHARYGSGSSQGDFATETLSFGGGGSDSVNNVAIGCGLQNQGLQNYGGLLGLGRSEVGFPSQIKASSFSYCLVDGNSQASSTLEFNSDPPGDSVIVSLLRNPKADIFYYVELTLITVGEDQIPIPPSVYQIGSDGSSGIVVDSGTTITYLDRQVYNSVSYAFAKYAQSLQPTNGTDTLDTCYVVPNSTASNITVPPISFQFSGGKTLPLPPQNYFIPVGISTNGQLLLFCLAFQPTNQPVSIIGNIQQQGMRVTYDLANDLIGFSPNKC